MLGTITNTCTIIIGSIVGAVIKKGIRPEWQRVLFTAMGLASLALGFNAVCHNMPNSEYPVLFILSLSIGGLIGTMLDLDGRFKRLVDKISKKPKEDGKAASKREQNDACISTAEREQARPKDKEYPLAQGLSTGVLPIASARSPS